MTTQPATKHESDPLSELKELGAGMILGVSHSWEIPPAADRALSDGVYSDSLAQLATITCASRSEVEPLLRRCFVELALHWPDRAQSAWQLTAACMRRIATEHGRTRKALGLLKDIMDKAADVIPSRTFVGDGLDLGILIAIYWSYTEPGELDCIPASQTVSDEVERHAALDNEAQREARAWLSRHPDLST